MRSEATGEGDEGLPDRSWVLRFGARAGSLLWEDALETAERRLALLDGDRSPAAQRQTKDWLKRQELALIRLRRPEAEIEAVRNRIFAAPPPDLARDRKQIDLTTVYNASLYDNRGWANSPYSFGHLTRMVETFVPRRGVSFDLRGVIQLESGTSPDGDTYNSKFGHSYPKQVEGIEVGQSTPAVHFLISCHRGRAEAGDEVAKFVMRYEGGGWEEFRVRYRDDIADWWVVADRVLTPPHKVGWRGWIDPQREVIISELVWENPHPERTIESIDFISGLKAAAPFLLGITLE